MPQYYIWTIGCQMNKAESSRLTYYLKQKGYHQTDHTDEADLILINSCVVRQSAENRVVNKLNTLKYLKNVRSNLTIAVTGCLVNSDSAALKKRFPHVSYFFKPGDLPDWLIEDEAEPNLPGRLPPTAFIPIIQGCNNTCSYCIVPYRRGRERSRAIEDILCEVKEHIRRGVSEVTLLGQNVDAYGHDLPNQPDLADLLTELNKLVGLARIRFLTNHPKDLSRKLINAVADLDKVCELINLPVQSGSDYVLDMMKRGYTSNDYRNLVGEIRCRVPGVAMSTDIIVAFPTEDEQHFQCTVDLLTELRFDTVHVAAYSPRPGTIAARNFNDNIPSNKKKERLTIIENLQKEIAGELNASLINKSVEVLVEGRKNGRWYGRTRTGKLTFFDSEVDCLGRLLNVVVERTSPWSLQGRVL